MGTERALQEAVSARRVNDTMTRQVGPDANRYRQLWPGESIFQDAAAWGVRANSLVPWNSMVTNLRSGRYSRTLHT